MTETKDMTSRERVLAAARGKPVDRVPVMYWLNPHMGCRLMEEYRPAPDRKADLVGRTLWRRFVKQGEMDAGEWTRALPNVLIGYSNGHYLAELGSDTAFASIGSQKRLGRMLGMIRRRNGHLLVKDALGCVRGVGGIYLDVIEPPIKSAAELASFELPELSDATDVLELRRRWPEICIMVEVSGVQQVISDVLCDMVAFMLALYDSPEQIAAFQRRLADWTIDQAWNAVKAGADVVFIGDDYGATGRPRISMEMWKALTYPNLKRIIDSVHDMGALAMLHSCGYQMPFLEHYCEAGLDILQSLQPGAGNDFRRAAEACGDRLCFATGIDTQRGESMSPEELRDDIVRSYKIGRTHGRFILSMTHMMQCTMPMENVRAILDTVRDIRAGLCG